MKIAVLGTGVAGNTIADRLLELGHEVVMGSRDAPGEKVQAWVRKTGGRGRGATFADAATTSGLVFNCTLGTAALEIFAGMDATALAGRILVDVSNPLDFSKGFPPTLSICNTDSLGEAIQRLLPKTLVVKTLNTCAAEVMVKPALVPGRHDVFICGNDAAAKRQVGDLLRTFGWQSIIDLGDISAARGTEQLLPVWLRLWNVFGTPRFNFSMVKA